jgi:hypothetical protein
MTIWNLLCNKMWEVWWFRTIIPATWEAESRGSQKQTYKQKGELKW